MQRGNIIVGQVHQVFEESRVLIAEEWMMTAGFYDELPTYSQTLVRENFTMPMEKVFGPLVSEVVSMFHPKGLQFVKINLEFMRENQPDRFNDRSGELTELASSAVG